MGSPLSIPPAIPAGALAVGPQPILAAAGDLVLRPWQPSDARIFYTAYQDPMIQHWHTRQPASEDQAREWFEQYGKNWGQAKGASWAITRGGTEVLGRLAMGSLNLDDGVAGCSYWVLPTARCAGVASHALIPFSSRALGDTGFHVCTWTTRPATTPHAASPSKPASGWKAPNAVTPCTPMAATTCICTRASAATPRQ